MEQLLSILKCSILVGAAVLGMVLLRPVLGRRYQARWRCALWIVLAAVLLLPLLPSQQWADAVADRAPIRIEVPAAEPIVIRPAVTPPPESQTPVAPAPAVQGAPGGTAAPALPSSPRRPGTTERGSIQISLPAALRAVWLAGMALFALYFALGNFLFYRRTVRWSRPASDTVRRQLADAADGLGLRRRPALLVSGYVKSPMVIGLLRPRLVLPAEDYTQQELTFILRHELTHCKRGDLWVKLLLLTANGVHWFNPLIYLMVREASRDMELTCDDAVVAGADRETRKAYSETLLASLHRQSGPALSTHFYGGAKTMKERFQNILAGGGRKRGIAVLCAVLVLLAAAGLGVALTEQKPEPLTAEELAQWQERLSEPGWSGFLTHMYGAPERINLQLVLYQGAGLGHDLTAEERTAAHDAFFDHIDGRVGDAFTETFGEPWENRIIGIRAADLEAYLQEHTGLGFGELSRTRQWNYLEEYDSYYILNTSTDTLRMEVLSGERQGDTLRLTIRREQEDWNTTLCGEAGIPWEDPVLTITDGKAVSCLNPLYAGAEAAAMAAAAQTAEAEGVQAVLSQPLTLRMACRAETGDYYEWQATFRLTAADAEPRYSSVRMITRLTADGVTETLEASQSDIQSEIGSGSRDYLRYVDLGYSFPDYVRYCYDYGLTLSRRDWSWPATSTLFYEDLQAGRTAWAEVPEVTAAQWLMACGDELVSAETVYENQTEPPREPPYKNTPADRDVLLRCTTAGGRQVLLLLSCQVPQEGGQSSHWSVSGCKVESGEALPEPDPDYRFESTQLRYTADGEERQVPAGLVSGGTGYRDGAYTDHAWDIQIPLSWTYTPVYTYDSFAACWYPSAADRGEDYLKISWSGHADADSFYQSYLPQYEDTENNRRSLDSGTATAAWARGTQELSGQTRYTESLWVSGGQGPFEVLWTSTDPALMAEMRAAALTFTLAGEDPPALGEIEPVTLMGQSVSYPGYREVWQQADTEWIQAGTYLVLTPRGWAFRVEDYFMENAEHVRALMNASSSHYPAPFGDIHLDYLELARSQDSGFPKEDDGLCTLFIYRADWAMETTYEGIPTYYGGTVDEDGHWHTDGTPYLVLEADYGRGCISRSFLMHSEYEPDSEAFQQELKMVETGLSSSVWVTELGIDNRLGVTEHTSHPAIFYDSTVGELFAVHSSPVQGDGSRG